MEALPLVSIALATFNGDQYLEKQIDSLLAQDYPNTEIVVSDDGSTDKTWQILERYAAGCERIRLLPRKQNLGVTLNFARCFSMCKGELISPSDQDDIWYPAKTRVLVDGIADALLAYCNSRHIDAEGRPTGQSMSDVFEMIDGSDARPFIFSNSVYGHAMIFQRRLLRATTMAPGVPHDWWLAFVAASVGRIAYIDEILVDYRRHAHSITHVEARSRSKAQRQKFLDADAQRLEAMSRFPGPYQEHVQNLRASWLAWRNGYLGTSMFLAVLKEGSLTHRAFLKEKSSFRLAIKYLVGNRLKKSLRPAYYPS